MNTIFARTIGTFGGKAAQTPLAILSKDAVHAPGKLTATLTPVRQFQDVRTLRIPGPLVDQDIDFYGQTALNKVGLSTQAISYSEAGWETGMASLNRAAFSGMPLSRQFKLTRTDSAALTLAFIQAGTRLKLDIDSPALLSLAYNLLTSLPVEAELLSRFRKYADKLAAEIIPYSHLLSEEQDWPDVASSVRLEVIRDLFSKMYPLAQEFELAPGLQETVALDLDGDVYNSPIAAGFFLVAIDGRGLQRDPGRVRLSRQLIEGDFSSFAAGIKNRGELAIVAPALSVAALSHEIFHAWQYSRLDTLTDKGPPNAQATKNAISISCQSVIATKGLGTEVSEDNTGQSRLLPHLPHEQEAWALTFFVLKALHESVAVPERYKPGIRNYFVNNFDVFTRCIGGAPAPRPTRQDGQLWDRSGELCLEIQNIDAARSDAEITRFLSDSADQTKK